MPDFQWDGLHEMVAQLSVYEQKVNAAAHAVANYFAPVIETYAKDNAPWTDRTGNARQGLHGFVEDVSESVVAIVLAHGMDYGKWLELAHHGRYAIILPSLENHYQAVADMLQGIFG